MAASRSSTARGTGRSAWSALAAQAVEDLEQRARVLVLTAAGRAVTAQVESPKCSARTLERRHYAPRASMVSARAGLSSTVAGKSSVCCGTWALQVAAA